MYQYSGPGSQQVANDWLDANDYWFMMLSQQGYITVCVDGRGTGFKGADFKKVTQKQLGKYEVEDQMYLLETGDSLTFAAGHQPIDRTDSCSKSRLDIAALQGIGARRV